MAKSLNKFTNESVTQLFALKEIDDKIINLYGFCQNIKVNKKMIFVILRKQTETIQLIVFKNENKEVYDKLCRLKLESTIYVEGVVTCAEVKSCTVTHHEIKITNMKILSDSMDLPFSLDDANQTFHSDSMLDSIDNDTKTDANPLIYRCNVSRQTRLDNRWLDLRIPINQYIFRLRSQMEHCIREVLMDQGFCEIHTPKIIPAVSEGGSNVFDVNYFGKKVYLAQSPQLYKQMMINAGFEKVFEIGPVFRAENANTYRHLCEFTGLDLEFEIHPDGSHIDVIQTIWSILHESFDRFEKKYSESIEYVLNVTKTNKLIFPKEPLIIDFKTGCRILAENGIQQDLMDDIGTVNEKILGDLIKNLYSTDVYVLAGYPTKARPFYTMKTDDPLYTRSFDIMMRSNEISSGAQRVHSHEQLEEAIVNKGIVLDGTSGLEDYLRSFKTGSVPHGGCGIGIERIVMLYLGLSNVRTTTLFSRDPKRTTP
jgi:aspartyl-tRNA synthetase